MVLSQLVATTTWLSSYEYNSYTATKNLDDAPVGVKYAICIYWAMVGRRCKQAEPD